MLAVQDYAKVGQFVHLLGNNDLIYLVDDEDWFTQAV